MTAEALAQPDHDRRSRPTAVVFDLGGVLIDWNPRYLYRSVFEGDEAAMERFLSEVATQEWNHQQDAGRPWLEAIESLAAEHPEYREAISAFWHRWIEMLGDAITPTVEILTELRATSIRLLALTNWSAETFPLARPRYPFLEWFDGIVVSGEVGLAKPDVRIFRHLIEQHGLDPAATVFIDDSIHNVVAARGLGLIGLHFQGAEGLRDDLVGLGLLPPRTGQRPALNRRSEAQTPLETNARALSTDQPPDTARKSRPNSGGASRSSQP